MYDEALADRIRAVLAGGPPFTEQKMFGGITFLINGNMAVGIVRGELIVRTGPAGQAEALAQPFARPFDFTGRPMSSMVMIAAEGLAGDGLERWVSAGAAFAAELPPKAATARNRAGRRAARGTPSR